MLKQRIITALILLALLLPTLFASQPQPFVLLTLILITAAAWEWGRMNGLGRMASLFSGVLGLAACLAVWWLGWIPQATAQLWLLTGAAWVLLGAWMLRRGVAGWSQWPMALRWPLGLVALCLAWLALAQARWTGTNFLLSVLVLVWAADVFAYFAGRALGGRWIKAKLAGAISPGKTWEGVLGGMVGVWLVSVCWMQADLYFEFTVESFYTRLWHQGAWFWLAALVFMTAMSVVGDLVESLIKRSAGVKDSSGLLPGHGGVLDRVDALLPTLPLAMMLVSWTS
jgi:phosphatidate cytidylyltransferase